MSNTIRDRQLSAIKCMLNFGKPITSKVSFESEFKILIYDKIGQDIILPLLSVRDLHDLGVTLYLQLNTLRSNVSDVPAVYFVSPTDANIKQICSDMKNGLYDSYHFNFISQISRTKLEDLAEAAMAAGVETKINKIHDQFVNFISLEKDMFTLNSSNSNLQSYYNLNKPDLKNNEIVTIVESVVNSLYCIFVTLGTLPVIRCPEGNIAEMVAKSLNEKLGENFRDARNSFFSSISSQSSNSGMPMMSFQRPLLLIVDRNIDLATPLHHTWTYQALVHDLLEFNLNSVKIPSQIDNGDHKKSSKVFNLGVSNTFWQEQKGKSFPEVADAVQQEIEKCKNNQEEIKRLKATMGYDGSGQAVDVSDNTAKLTHAMGALPKLMEEKRQADMHTDIATSLLACIKDRKLDEFYELEEKILAKSSAAENELYEFLNNSNITNNKDRMRIFLLYYLSNPSISEADSAKFIELLQKHGCDTSSFNYIKQWKQFNNSLIASSSSQQQGGGTKSMNMFTHLMNTGSQFVMEGVKNLVIKKQNLPVTKVLDQLMELKEEVETEKYLYFDPKLARRSGNMARKSKSPYSNAIVFVVGGGNYIEYQNLTEYAKSKNGKQVSYGCMELLNSEDFLEQLNLLGV